MGTITVKEFLSPFSFLPYSVEFYEWETDVDGELIVEWWCPLPDLPQREERKEELEKTEKEVGKL